MINLFEDVPNRSPVQLQDRVISYLPQDEDHILVQYTKSNSNGLGVYKLHVAAKENHVEVMRGTRNVLTWMADATGEVRLGFGVRSDDEAFLTVRLSDAKKWFDLSHRIADQSVVFEPLAFTSDPNTLYVASNHEGDPTGLYSYDFTIDEFGPLIIKNPDVDIASISVDERTSELVSVNFMNDVTETSWFSRKPIEDDIERLNEETPDEQLLISSVSDEGNHAVVMSRAESGAEQYLVYNKNKDVLQRLPAQYTMLKDQPLGVTIATEYEARDGLSIPAFVTLPPGIASLDDARGLPFVIHPHGGPAARGFPQVRLHRSVSRVKGLRHPANELSRLHRLRRRIRAGGKKQWGQAMQDDITDGVSWLVESGWADPQRIAIAGGSYGGYAALMGVVKTPDLYRCAVSFAGVSGLPELVNSSKHFSAGKYMTRHIGDLWKDHAMLEEEFACTPRKGDTRTCAAVARRCGHCRRHRAFEENGQGLRRHKVDHEFIVFEQGDHYLSRYDNRLRYLIEIEQFLGGCLAPPADSAVAADARSP